MNKRKQPIGKNAPTTLKTTANAKTPKPAVKTAAPKKADSYTSTADIDISKTIIDQVIGQEEAVEIIKKASKQRRHVLLIGEPGTGKSMLGLALAELLPKEKLVDILSFPNQNDENQPLIRTVKSGEGRKIVLSARLSGESFFRNQGLIMLVLAIVAMIAPWWIFKSYTTDYNSTVGAIMFVAFFVGGMVFLVMAILFMNMGKRMSPGKVIVPKVIVDNFQRKESPFYDATGAHAGALLGDVLHDPFQSGGLGTPAHERVVAGMIHKAHMGVLFIDEIATLQPHTQQELLTALQEGQYPITGQSERSAGAMVRTEAVPCSFILVAAGNLETIQHLHPALRSRIRGYGYEVYMRETMSDTAENRYKIAKFIAQEVAKDKRIPHFSKAAIDVIIQEARRRANHKGHLTLRLRELGGLIRAAGDLAVEKGAKLVEPEHIFAAREVARPLEQQIADKFIERKKEYEVIITKGKLVGRVNGLAVIGSGSTFSGIILPIESQVTPGGKQQEIIATGKLGDIAKEAVKNVSAIIKSYFGEDMKEKYDIYVQFLQTYEGVEGDSASIAVAITIISSLADAPIKQNYAVTGSLSVRGDVLPVGGVSAKVEAAIEAGIEHVIVPESNLQDIVIDEAKLKRIKIIPVKTIIDVVDEMIDWKGKEKTRARFNSKKRITL
ncbi:TPA: ATP-dependent protease LonB [Candidatus Woesearchaeota archaeon]|nr:ATP-dependent protease LonB [Candidatus Woesearchaeota archaeon]